MPAIKIVVIGASAGGLQPLTEIVDALPIHLDVAIFVVVHTRTEGNSYLPEILSRTTSVPIAFAVHGQRIKGGTIVIAPPNHHLLITKNRMMLSTGPKENGFRPAVDPLFRTAARAHGADVMGIILSGALDDGSYGLKMVKHHGGIAVVQHPDDASHPSMPLSAIRVVDADFVLPASEIGRVIAGHGATADQGDVPMARREEPEPQFPADEVDVQDMQAEFGPASGLTCPDCGGALWEISDAQLTRYRCHVGHQYSAEALDAEQQQVVEGALWSAVRILQEHADLRTRMAERSQARGLEAVAAGFADSARESHRQAHTIRALLLGRALPEPAEDTPSAPAAATRAKGRRPE
ncbi:MAG TPA: chemotaxis protein CheB [Vicinamibacterales bacterium]